MTFCDVIESLCKHPQMYTMSGTFEEVVAWIEGYTMNVRNHRPDARFQWHNFSRWLARKRNYPDHIVAARHLRQAYPDDKEALAALASLFHEFASSSDFNQEASPK